MYERYGDSVFFVTRNSKLVTLHHVQRDAPAPTPCKHMVSGLFHRPHRTAFHLSLTVLVHYRSQNVFSLTG